MLLGVVVRLAIGATFGYIVTHFQPLGRSETDAKYRSHGVEMRRLQSLISFSPGLQTCDLTSLEDPFTGIWVFRNLVGMEAV